MLKNIYYQEKRVFKILAVILLPLDKSAYLAHKKIYIRFSTLFAELLNRFLVCPHVIELFFDGKLYVGRKQEHEIRHYYGHNGWHAT